jgi:hypothetical protein
LNRLKIISLAGLTLLDVAAALFVWRAFSGAEAADRPPPGSAPSIVPAALSDAPITRQGEDSETLARPLFWKSRRPSQAGFRPANEPSHAPAPADLKLHAIIGFNYSNRAFVTSRAAADGKWLSVGETFESWTVDSITSHEIALRQDVDLLRVGLDYDEVAAPAAPSPPPQPPAKVENRDEAAPPKGAPPDPFSAARNGRRSER